ncbi:MAG: capsule biosynthesis GfcC family protein, partial [Shewanella sp.]
VYAGHYHDNLEAIFQMNASTLLLTILSVLVPTSTFAAITPAPLHAEPVNISLVYARQEGATVTLPAGAHLADLLFDPRLPQPIDWRSAQISDPQRQARMQAEKASLLQDLKLLQVRWMRGGDKGALVQSAQQLLQEIDRIAVSGRVPVALDPVMNRSKPGHNPLLVGAYTLYLAPRSPHLYFTGLINGPARQPLRAVAGLADYWQDYALLAGADLAHAWLIQPTGEIMPVPVAAFNALHREPMAGATLFVGFDPALLPAEYQHINDRIANLIANRIPE